MVKIELRSLSLNDGKDIFDMLQQIGPGENGFSGSGYDIDFADFPAYLNAQIEMSNGIGIDLKIYVPQTRYWLYVDGRPVGMGKLRHYLNDSLRANGGHIGYSIRPSERRKGYGNILLRELLIKAGEKEIDEVLITCQESNIRSRKVIEHNGGILEDTRDGTCRSWIHVNQPPTPKP